MLLSVKKRQTYLKELGFYTGNIDGKVGKLTKAAYKALQDKYFTREQDRDGKYGKDTDKLLRNAYNVKKYTKNFKLEEFKCHCGGKYCTGYPATLDAQFLKNLQSVRDKFGSTKITSALRCNKHNANVGGSSGSRHKLGKAADIITSASGTESGRKKIMAYWKTLPRQSYTYCNIGGSNPGMGTATHVDIL
jgi:peptidoglycan hydrolase-like protein with peptidoglycan-binding domain